ncbi:hypothetical protein [Subdoligranulum variabile]|nr:hypothetical protein [Subdoligranulum variabile]UWP69001.1 hypothetical protein NQ490_03880 [Subdoligranulum variabile]
MPNFSPRAKVQQYFARMTRAERAVLALLCVFAVKFLFSTAARFLPVLQWVDSLGSGRHPVDLWLLLLCCTAVLGTFCLYRRALHAVGARLTRFDGVVLAVCCLLSAAFYLHAMVGRQSLYLWDNATYYNLQIRLESNFADGVFMGVGSTIYKTWFNDYAPFVINILLEPFFMFTARTANTFAILCALLIPSLVYFSALVFLMALRRQLAPRAPRLFTVLGMAFVLLMPLMHVALYRGMPDLLGVAFAFMLMALLTGYDFDRPAPARLVSLTTFTGLLILTRRSYMFTVVTIFLFYGVRALVQALRGRNRQALLRFVRFAVVSVLCVGLPLAPMFWRIVRADYSDRYATYQTGGFLSELNNQRVYLGYFLLAVLVVGVLYGLYKKGTKFLSVLSIAGAVLTILLVTRVQNMDDHQSLAVAPFYLLGFFLCALAVANLRPWPLRAVPAAVLGGMCVLNFGACSQLLPPRYIPTEVYSGLYFFVDDIRDDMEGIAAVNDWLRENCSGTNSAYMICHGSKYSADVFRAAALPDESIRSILAYGAVNPGNDAFPKELFTAQAVLTCTPFDPNNHTEKINSAFLENQDKYQPFEVAATFDMGNGYTITAYRRIKAPTVEELDTYRRWLAEEDAQFPYNFSAVWDQLETEFANNG